jgi:hypothetical protein
MYPCRLYSIQEIHSDEREIAQSGDGNVKAAGPNYEIAIQRTKV